MLSFIANPNKRLVKTEAEKDNMIKVLINGFFNYFEREKTVFQIAVDESRNYLYALTISSDTNGQREKSDIEVFDLGALGTKFKKIISITLE